MAYLSATTYHSLITELGNKDSKKIGNNTVAYHDHLEYAIYVKLHGKTIVKLTLDSISVTLAGWPTVTTRDRVNQFLPTGTRIYQKDWCQYLITGDDCKEIDSHDWYTFPTN